MTHVLRGLAMQCISKQAAQLYDGFQKMELPGSIQHQLSKNAAYSSSAYQNSALTHSGFATTSMTNSIAFLLGATEQCYEIYTKLRSSNI